VALQDFRDLLAAEPEDLMPVGSVDASNETVTTLPWRKTTPAELREVGEPENRTPDELPGLEEVEINIDQPCTFGAEAKSDVILRMEICGDTL
jgi:hypothetical protein